jgi:hypothetical protein
VLGSNIKGYARHCMIQLHHVCKAKTITDRGYPLAYYIKIFNSKGKNALKLEVKLNMCISFKYSKFLNLGPLSAVFH